MRTTSAILVLALGCTVGEDAPPSRSLLDLESALLVATRDRLQVCLHLDPDIIAQTDALASRLRADLVALRAHPDWHAAGLERGDVTVAAGCPGAPVLEAAVDGKGAGGAVLGPGLTSTPSPYRLHLHALGDARASVVLGDLASARAIAELVPVDEHRVAEVSTALVVRASALGTAVFQQETLAPSLGLRAPSP